jgi:hypothetical protein
MVRSTVGNNNVHGKARGRPIGLLLAWLEAGSFYPTQAAHKRAANRSQCMGADRARLTREIRARLRQEFKKQYPDPKGDPWMCERPKDDDEDEEPEGQA